MKQHKSGSFVLRYLSEFRYGLKCSRVAKALNADYEIITVPFISLIITSKLIRSNAFQILDVRDIQWEYLKESGLVAKFMKRILKGMHLFFLRKYDLITLTNPYEMSILEKDITERRKELMSNGITQVQFDEIQKELTPRVKAKGDPWVITYVGNVGVAQNLGTFIEAIKDFESFELVIVGDGNDYQRLKDLVEKKGISNVKLIGRVPIDRVFEFYKNTDFLWAKLDPNYLSAVPSKLYEYLATGKPLIYSGKGAAIELLNKFEQIYLVEDNESEIRSLLKRISHLEYSGIPSFNNIDLIRREYIRERINKKLLRYFSNAE